MLLGPDLTLTKQTNNLFVHSPKERNELVKAILNGLGVDQLDMVLSHSSGVYTAAELWQDKDAPKVRSMAWLNPTGFDNLPLLEPDLVIRSLIAMYLIPPLERTAFNFTKNVLSFVRPYASEHTKETLFAFMAYVHNNRKSFRSVTDLINRSQMPILYCYSDTDTMVNKSYSAKLLQALNCSIDEATWYDKDGHLLMTGNRKSNNVELVRFGGGNHFSFIKYFDLLNNHVDQFLERLDETDTYVNTNVAYQKSVEQMDSDLDKRVAFN